MNIPNARERILETAARIFAEKSFEGSRIDEIARRANVPKSLIYYHFKSKDDILRVLTENFMKEYLAIIDQSKNEKIKEKTDKINDRMKTVYYEFGKRNEDLVRVMLIDSLKKTKENPILFDVVKAMTEIESEEPDDAKKETEEPDDAKKNLEEPGDAKKNLEEPGEPKKESEASEQATEEQKKPYKEKVGTEDRDKTEEIQKRRIAEFFTSFMPNYAYICFADAWIKYFEMDRAQFDKLYLEVYEETHGAYHRNKEHID